jgi:hypothetical protein
MMDDGEKAEDRDEAKRNWRLLLFARIESRNWLRCVLISRTSHHDRSVMSYVRIQFRLITK